MIVAGEASGDGHAGRLVRALRNERPETHFEFFGAAGPKMREAGVEAVVESDGLSIVGLAEIGRALPMFLRASRDLRAAAARRKPDVVVLVDFPDFNLKLAKSLKKLGLKIVYYISPQLWAWRKYRTKTVRNSVDLMLAILPFEQAWYAQHGVSHVEYVGNPLAREVHADQSKEEFCRDHGLDSSQPIISLLPGSRNKEIVRILPVMMDAAASIASTIPSAQFVIAVSSSPNRQDVEMVLGKQKERGSYLIVENETYNCLNASEAAAVTSGTATLETAIIGTPMAVVYKTSALNYFLLERFIDVQHYGLVNLIAGERVARELIQSDFTADAVAGEILELLEPENNAAMRVKLKAVSEKLGHGGASRRAAQAILRTMEN